MILISELLKKVETTVKPTVQSPRNIADANKEATHRSNVNEYLLAHHLAKAAGLKDTRPGETEQEKQEAQKRHDDSKTQIHPDEYRHQNERAKHMAQASIEEYKNRGIDLTKAKSVHITAGKGVIKKITGLDIDSSDNTSDVMLKVPHKKFGMVYPGISAKSNKSNTKEKLGTERISNRGLEETSRHFGQSWHSQVYGQMDRFARENNIHHLPLVSKSNEGGRKGVIRSNKDLTSKAKLVGDKILTGVRDSYMNHMSKMSPEEVKKHLASHHFRTNDSKTSPEDQRTPYIVASGHGTSNKDYGAHAHGMEAEAHPHVHAMQNAHHFSFEPAGDKGFHVYAHKDENDKTGAHIINVAAKHNSQPMASSVKLVGTEGTLRGKKSNL